MRAVWYDKQGAARDVLTVGEMPTPTAGHGEVRVRLVASGVNPSDCNRRRGDGHPMEHPRVVPNSDGAGVVDQVGPGAPRTLLGRRVWLHNGQRGGRAFGTAAEAIALAHELVAPLPEHADFEAGACLGIPAMTAHWCVFGHGPVRDHTVLVTGGAGAVGHYAVQLAKWGGARVIATVSNPAKAEHARAAGADLVLNYRTDDVPALVLGYTGGRGVDRIVEVDFGGNLATSLAVLAVNSVVAVYASNGNRTPIVPVQNLMRRNVTIASFILNALPLEARQRAQRDIGQWLAETPAARHTVAARFPLARTAEAHAFVETGSKLGTVVVRCDE
jgi:NADPH:quinone reductase